VPKIFKELKDLLNKVVPTIFNLGYFLEQTFHQIQI
jgi:hypothetical protein